MKIATWIIVGCVAASVQASTVLFENFEPGNGVAIGSLDGQNGWLVDRGTGDVQSHVVQAGDQALEISGGGFSMMRPPPRSTLWLYFHARITEAPQIEPLVNVAAALAAFYVNTNLNLVVLSNGVPVELAAQMPTHIWTRFDVYCDSAAGIWNLAMNGVHVVSGLPLVSSNSAEQVVFSNESTASAYLDSFDIADAEQVGEMPDTDADGIPDWWEQKHFGDTTACTAGAPSGNGDLTYEETYIAVLDPFAYDPLFVALENSDVVWTPKPSRLYDVEWTPSLHSNFVAIASEIAWPTDHYPDAAHTNEPASFYRVKIHL